MHAEYTHSAQFAEPRGFKITKKQKDWQFWTLRGFIFALQEMDEGKEYD